ncbi:MAG: radical SAM protein [Deltaproteobacteria bacterium]|nr:radical SAM protein [Deltaproteobacteria bacterium]
MQENYSFEQGPIRPPSEAKSLLIRATRNCPWNKCAFCHTYRNTKFELRSVEEIKDDIQKARDIADYIRELSWKHGEGGHVGKKIVNLIYSSEDVYNDSFRSIAAWLYYGGESVFIQDANSIIMKTDDLVYVLSFIRDKFPSVNRITSYCRSKTATRKSVEEFKMLKEAGLSRIHIGMESGYDPLLKLIRKGVTASEHIEGGRRIMEAGISLCEYVMPGLGGDRWSNEHAEETAKAINQINPDFVRLRSLHVVKGTDLFEMMLRGDFNPIGEEDVLKEIRKFIENLDGIETTIVSDHILNLIEELNGKLPEDKEKLLGIIDGYFSLSEEERLIYRIGRRIGMYTRLADLSDKSMYSRVTSIIDQYRSQNQGQLDKDLLKIMNTYIQ